MAFTEQQTQLAKFLDAQVQRLTESGVVEDLALLGAMAEHMNTFQQLLDSSTPAEMDLLCERYPGFSRFGQVLERLADGIASGRIPVPQ